MLASFHTVGLEIYLGRALRLQDEGLATVNIVYRIRQDIVPGHTLQPEIKVYGEETREIRGWSPSVIYPKPVFIYHAGFELGEDQTPRAHTIYSAQRACVQKVLLKDLDQNRFGVVINPLVIKNLGTAAEESLVNLEITDASGMVLARATDLRGIKSGGVTVSLSTGNTVPDDAEKELLLWVTAAGPERTISGRTVQLELVVFHAEGGAGYQRTIKAASVFTLENNRPPVVDFTWSPEAPMWGKPVAFTPTVSDPDGDAIVYSRWDFGGAASPIERSGPPQEVTVTFPREGTFPVTLLVRDAKGLEAQKTKSVTVTWVVESLPLAPATVYSTQRFVAQKIRLADKDADGDPVTLSKVKVKNLGTAADAQFVKLEVRQGGEDGALLVETTNLAGFKGAGLTLTPAAHNVIPDDGTMEIWIWVTLAGPEKTEDNKTLILETVFTYTEGRASGDTPALQGPTFTIRLNRPPVVDFTWSPESPSWQDTITFTPQASDPDDDRLIHFEWDFGDRTDPVITTTAQPVRHRYPEGGEFRVTLTVKDEKGLSSSKSKEIKVTPRPNQPPVVDFSWNPAQPVVNQSVTFVPQVDDPDRDTPFSFSWSFGPKATPATSTEERPTV
ncbi:MAG: PKD domain-containing protein, partial [Candidatus Bipolaricaulaceae bacterium]